MEKIKINKYFEDENYRNDINEKGLTLSYVDNAESIKEELDYLEVPYTLQSDVREIIESLKSEEFVAVDDDGNESSLYQVTDLKKIKSIESEKTLNAEVENLNEEEKDDESTKN